MHDEQHTSFNLAVFNDSTEYSQLDFYLFLYLFGFLAHEKTESKFHYAGEPKAEKYTCSHYFKTVKGWNILSEDNFKP